MMENFGASNFISVVKNIPGLDPECAVDAIGGSEELYEKILRKTTRLLPSHIEQMDVHIAESGDLGVFAAQAHGVKSSLRQIGAFSLAKLAESLEEAAKEKNRQYCTAHYSAFRDEATRFYSLLSEIASRDAADEPEFRNAFKADWEKLFDAIPRAGRAAAEFDTLSASEILSPFAGLRFDPRTDLLISRASEALDKFKPGEALMAIEALLKEFEKQMRSNGEDEA